MILEAYGIRVQLPAHWSGRIFSRSGKAATLHAADFRPALDDGEFGDRSTTTMPSPGAFIALTEYLPGRGLDPGGGLFASSGIPLPLDPTGFSFNRLAHPRPGHVGMQHFFTASGRPLCLYLVLTGPRSGRRGQLATLDAILRSLRVSPPARGG